MRAVHSFRLRYLVGLGVMACLLIAVGWLLHSTIQQQENYGRVIKMASNQVGLTNRIAFFAEELRNARVSETYLTAQQQIARAVNEMERTHRALLNGDPEENIPLIETELLSLIYYDPAAGLDPAVARYLSHARTLADVRSSQEDRFQASYVFVTTYGPYVLANLLDAAVTEYEAFAKREINNLKRLEFIAVAAGLMLLLIEAVFIFWPLERRLRDTFSELCASRDKLAMEKAAAEAANKSKTDFLSNMSHELRTPLNAIIGFSEAMRCGTYGPLKDETQKGALNDIHRSSKHLLALVNDILDISAAEAGALVLSEDILPVMELVDYSVSMMRPVAEKLNVGIDVQVVADPGLKLRVDRRRIHQILLNLLSNAVKFSGSDGRVLLAFRHDLDGYARFSVIDNGPGMTDQDILRASERFGQIENVNTRSLEGSGLGLPVAIQLADAHNGELQIKSRPGDGTTVTLVLPPERIYGLDRLRLVSGAD